MQHSFESPSSFEVRRLFLPSETDQIREMQLAAQEFTDHYPRHAEWLDKAISEILSGERVGFGIHEYSFVRPNKPKIQLVGSIILRENDYSGVIELKNLFIHKTARRKGYGRSLYKSVEQYCKKYGYASIQTEVPCTELVTVSFLHSMGFKVHDCEPSPYRPDEDIYIMSKRLSPLYNGDVFDLRQQAIWILKYYYGLIDRQAKEDRQAYELKVVLNPNSLDAKEALSPVSGLAVIEDNEVSSTDQEAVQLLRESKKHVKLLFAPRISTLVQQELDTYGVKWFDQTTIYATFGAYFAYSPASFERDEIAGMIVLIKPELLDRVKGDIQSYTYFKGGPTGKYLADGNNLLLLVEPSVEDPRDGIYGIAKIISVLVDRPEVVWTNYNDKNPLFTEEEFMRFSAKKSCLTAIEFSDVRRFSLLPTDDLLDKIISKQIETDELGHFYFNHSTLERILAERPVQTLPNTEIMRNYKVALSFAGEDRSHAEELASLISSAGITVFYDAYETADLWGKDLYQHLQWVYKEQSDFCVVFVSKHYKQKLWTKHELQQMQARAFRERQEYILPVRLDDTSIPGINETIGYLDLRSMSIYRIFEILLEKLNSHP